MSRQDHDNIQVLYIMWGRDSNLQKIIRPRVAMLLENDIPCQYQITKLNHTGIIRVFSLTF